MVLSWGQKNMLLVGVLVLSCWIAYNSAIGLTVQLARDCAALEKRVDSAEQVGAQVTALECELREAERIGGEATCITHEQLLDAVANYCAENALELRDYPAPLQMNREEWNVEIHQLTVAGSYTGIVQFMEYLRASGRGHIVSVSMFSKTDNKTKIRSLYATIYVQSISKNET